MTNIECTQCGDVVAVEARNVTLPYVCGVCERATETFTQEVGAPTPLTETDVEVAKFYEDIKPSGYAIDFPAVQKAIMDTFTSSQTVQAEPELTEEFASVENTTALISDLEAQLATEKLLSNSLHESLLDADRKTTALELEIKDLEAQLTDEKVISDSLDARFAELRQKVAFFENRQCPDLRETIDRLDRDNQTAQLQISYLETARQKDSGVIDAQAAKIRQQTAALDLFSIQFSRFIDVAMAKVKSLRADRESLKGRLDLANNSLNVAEDRNFRLEQEKFDLKAVLKAEREKSLWTKFKEQWVREREAAKATERKFNYYGD